MIMKKTYLIFALLFIFAYWIAPAWGQQPLPQPQPQAHSNEAPPNPFPFEDIKNEQHKPGEDRFISDFMNMLASLGLIIALIFIVSWFLKRFLNTRIQQMNTTSAIKIVERRALTPKSSIYLLEVNDRTMVIAESTNGVTLLSNLHMREQGFSNVLKDKESP